MGFSGKVPYLKYIAGTSVGALFSLSAQLLLGYIRRNNPAAVVAALSDISMFVAVVPSQLLSLVGHRSCGIDIK